MNSNPSDGWPLGFALLVAAADWTAVGLRRKRLEYLFKPAALLALIFGLALLMRGPHDDWEARFFLVGLFFSLAGDVFLMLPRDGFFLPGLVSFLLAHLCYIAGLNPSPPPVPSLVLFIPVAVVGGVLVIRIVTGLRAAAKTSLIFPVVIYGLVISLMLFSAWATLLRPDWSTSRRVTVITGATLFFASDAMLAWNRFVRPFDHADLGVIVSYHLGQLALVASTVEFP